MKHLYLHDRNISVECYGIGFEGQSNTLTIKFNSIDKWNEEKNKFDIQQISEELTNNNTVNVRLNVNSKENIKFSSSNKSFKVFLTNITNNSHLELICTEIYLINDKMYVCGDVKKGDISQFDNISVDSVNKTILFNNFYSLAF